MTAMPMFPMHIWALLIGCALDLLIGDPEWFPHPVRLIGALILRLEKALRARFRNLRAAAPVLTAATVLTAMAATGVFLWLCGLLGKAARLGDWPLLAGMSLISWTCVSARNLAEEAGGVAKALGRSLDEGRAQVARIVGRDTGELRADEVIRAAVETVAENTVDGVISPMIYLALGGPILAMGFKAASTLDSMVGYMNDQYRDLGWASARLDDLLNYIPARLTALMMCAVAPALRLNGARAFAIMRRDHKRHKSPNCAWPEAAAAGALGIRLGGTHLYHGLPVEKPTIGDALREPEAQDIAKVNRLMFAACGLALAAILLIAYR